MMRRRTAFLLTSSGPTKIFEGQVRASGTTWISGKHRSDSRLAKWDHVGAIWVPGPSLCVSEFSDRICQGERPSEAALTMHASRSEATADGFGGPVPLEAVAQRARTNTSPTNLSLCDLRTVVRRCVVREAVGDVHVHRAVRARFRDDGRREPRSGRVGGQTGAHG